MNIQQSFSAEKCQQQLRICLLGYRSAPHVGGQGVYLNYLSKALVDLGHQVDVISGQPYPELDPRIKLIKLPSLDLFSHPSHIKALRPKHLCSFSDTFEWWAMLTGGFAEPYTFSRRVFKYMRKYSKQYDVVHDNQCLGYGLLSLQKLGVPTIATVHHPITRDRDLALAAALNWRHRLLVRRWHSFLGMQAKVVRRLKHIVTVSEVSRSDIAEAFKRPKASIDLIYNGIDTHIFVPKPSIKRRAFTIMTTASADKPLKGLRYLLEAIAVLKNDYPKLELRVIGKMAEDSDTAKRLEQLNLTKAVQFSSNISTDQLVDYYAEATIVVSPSLYEGFGLPIGEAMSCGVPVISSNGGALPEVVGDAGIVVEAGNSIALSRAIKDLLDAPELRESLGSKGRERIINKFCWQVAAKQFTQYYHQVIASANN